jgi:hypothetical protein
MTPDAVGNALQTLPNLGYPSLGRSLPVNPGTVLRPLSASSASLHGRLRGIYAEPRRITRLLPRCRRMMVAVQPWLLAT